MRTYIVTLTAFLFTFISTALILRLTNRGSIGMDLPGRRKVHKEPTPRLGGIGISLGLFAALSMVDLDRALTGYVLGSVIILSVGILDDIKGLGWKLKMAGTAAAVTAVVFYGGVRVENLGNLFGYGDLSLGAWSIPFTYFCVIGVVSAMNMIDGLNGLASGLSIVILGALAYFSWLAGAEGFMELNIALAAATFAFLFFNYPEGRIFLGDSGSAFLGFTMAVTSIAVFQRGSSFEPMLPIIVLAVPIYDTLRVMSLRVLRGKSPFHADKTHMHHMILRAGVCQDKATLIIWCLSAAFSVAALLMRGREGWVLLTALIAGYLALTAFIYAISGALGPVARRRARAGKAPIRPRIMRSNNKPL